MNNRDLKKVLQQSLETENDLYEFITECLTRIYPDKTPLAIHLFDQDLEMKEFNGCLQSLPYYDQQINGGE